MCTQITCNVRVRLIGATLCRNKARNMTPRANAKYLLNFNSHFHKMWTFDVLTSAVPTALFTFEHRNSNVGDKK